MSDDRELSDDWPPLPRTEMVAARVRAKALEGEEPSDADVEETIAALIQDFADMVAAVVVVESDGDGL